MGKKTPMLLPPTLDEVLVHARVIHLPEREARKFFYYYESKGWKVGKGSPMAVWRSSLQGWKLRWEEKGGKAHNLENTSSQVTLKGKRLNIL